MIHQYGLTEVDSAANGPEELALLQALWTDILDPRPKQTYANWLRQHDAARAAYFQDYLACFDDWHAAIPATANMPRSWCHAIGARALEILRGLGLGEIEKEMLKRARPCLNIEAIPMPDEQIPSGESKMGGLADLPIGTPWPVEPIVGYDDPFPYEFCCQIRLSDLGLTLVSGILPSSGLLSVFVLGGGGPMIRLFAEDARLHQPAVPTHPDPDDPTPRPKPSGVLRFHETMDLPIRPEAFWDRPPDRVFDLLKSIDDFQSALWYQLHHDGKGDYDSHFRHLLLGYVPWCINAFPCPEDAVREHADAIVQDGVHLHRPNGFPIGLRHLLHHGSDDAIGWDLGDSYNHHFFVSEPDLAAGRFDRAVFCPG